MIHKWNYCCCNYFYIKSQKKTSNIFVNPQINFAVLSFCVWICIKSRSFTHIRNVTEPLAGFINRLSLLAANFVLFLPLFYCPNLQRRLHKRTSYFLSAKIICYHCEIVLSFSSQGCSLKCDQHVNGYFVGSGKNGRCNLSAIESHINHISKIVGNLWFFRMYVKLVKLLCK